MSYSPNIIHGDAIEFLRGLPSKSVDLIIADPPYNLNKDYGNNSDSKGFSEYISFSEQWVGEAARVLSDTGTIYVFMGFRLISYLYQILESSHQLRFNNWICWHYTQGIGKKNGFSPRHDDILMFTKGKQFTFNLDAIRVPQKYYRSINNMRGANPGDVWEFSHVHYCQDNRQAHPTQKPEGLMERMILASSNEGDIVIDLFSGSGTTARVCQQLRRNCIAVESNGDYVAMIKQRLEKPFTGFDSIDPRMERVPNDLNDEKIRKEYLANHVNWFLKHHAGAHASFLDSVEKKYGNKKIRQGSTSNQTVLF